MSATVAERYIFTTAKARESVPALVLGFAVAGIFFMFVPGTLLGVWNLISISDQHAAGSIAAEFIQAHGHAQIFGWMGTFIIGIGYASLPGARRVRRFGVDEGWLCLGLWTTGVLLRWSVGMFEMPWRAVLPLAAALELAGFLIFFRAVAGHRPEKGASGGVGVWALPVILGTVWLLAILVAQVGVTIWMAGAAESPIVPAAANQPMLNVTLWGFLVPFVWGFTARWAAPLFDSPATSTRMFAAGYLVSLVGAVAYAFSANVAGAALALGGAAVVAASLSVRNGFVRIAYGWLLVGAALGLAGALLAPESHGYIGASRHALTVGFLSTMVFVVGPRLLPALTGREKLFSPTLAWVAPVVLTAGCTMRVVAQVLAYQGFSDAAWSWLPVSAVTELTAVTLFALNMGLTFMKNSRG